MHLTNYSINKHNENFNRDDGDDSGSKRYDTTTLLHNKHILCILITAINTSEMHELFLLPWHAACIPLFSHSDCKQKPIRFLVFLPPLYGMRNLLLFPTSTILCFSLLQRTAIDLVFFCFFFPFIFLKLENCLDCFSRSIKFLNEWLQSMDYDVNFLWHNITVSFSKVHVIFKNLTIGLTS